MEVDRSQVGLGPGSQGKELGFYSKCNGPRRRHNIVNIYAPNIGAPQYIRQMLAAITGEIDSNTITVGDFNTRLTPMDRSSK